MYTSYNIFLLFRVLDFYFVCLLSFFIIMLVWCITGIIVPTKLPFFQVTQNRAIVIVIFMILCYGLFIITLIVESYFYERDPILTLKRNTGYLVKFFTNIHPFDGDSYSLNNEHALIQDNDFTQPQIDTTNTDDTLPPVHNVTIDEVKQEFPAPRPRHKRKDGPIA